MKDIYYILMIGCLLALLIRSRQLPRYCLWFIPIIFLAIIVEAIKDYFSDYRELAQRFYQAAECMLLLAFFNDLLRQPKNKKLLRWSAVAYFVAVIIYYGIYKGSFYTRDYFDFIVQAFIVCVFVCVFFSELLTYEGELNLVTYGAFWLNAINFMFYGGCFFALAMYSNLLNQRSEMGDILLLIPLYLNLFLYSAYLVIFLLVKRNHHAI